MQFDSLDGVETFYKEFSKKEGFGIRIRTSKKAPRSDNACRSCSSLRTGCAAMLRVMKNKKLQKWVVKGFDNHNHCIISPKSVSYLRCQKKMSTIAKSLVEKFGEEGLLTRKVVMMFNEGDQTFTSRDCWNNLRDVRGKKLDVGDASTVLNYCQNNKLKTPISFMQFNVKIMAYQYFGDVVTFDMTYKTNRYDMSYASFTGLNRHCQSILFGCALLQDVTEQTFVWLFETWLQVMWEKEPKSIITDQDFAMGAAIAKVFPRTQHHLCLCHIKKKFPKKLSHIYHKKSICKRELKRCRRESPRTNTTQRSKSINAFFDTFVNSRTTLQDFKERKEDFDSSHKLPSLVIGSKIEHQAASIYMRTIFSKFKKESASSNFYKGKVTSSFDPDDAFIVKLNLESKVCECDYQLFEFMGIVCRHIPSHYILQHWKKEANKEIKSVEYRSRCKDEHHMSRALRSIHVCHRVNIYKMIISDLDHTLKKAFGMENQLLEGKENDEMDMHYKSGELANIVEVEDYSLIVPLNIKDPHLSQTKGQKKSSGLQISTTKRKSCQLCRGYGHNRRTCKQYNGEGSDY
ncbi:hypothetical protein RGQ29_018201 [Quercus rubra]|uniref:Protein FAR1-RELATED SEQUENCE n=1 Tax=Quercus rubra TaxID=3512 RepID=A0AAN7FIQ9_QUERU|nr:hypothetical protein RGQ29_018201 [Quercus rubra]